MASAAAARARIHGAHPPSAIRRRRACRPQPRFFVRRVAVDGRQPESPGDGAETAGERRAGPRFEIDGPSERREILPAVDPTACERRVFARAYASGRRHSPDSLPADRPAARDTSKSPLGEPSPAALAAQIAVGSPRAASAAVGRVSPRSQGCSIERRAADRRRRRRVKHTAGVARRLCHSVLAGASEVGIPSRTRPVARSARRSPRRSLVVGADAPRSAVCGDRPRGEASEISGSPGRADGSTIPISGCVHLPRARRRQLSDSARPLAAHRAENSTCRPQPASRRVRPAVDRTRRRLTGRDRTAVPQRWHAILAPSQKNVRSSVYREVIA